MIFRRQASRGPSSDQLLCPAGSCRAAAAACGNRCPARSSPELRRCCAFSLPRSHRPHAPPAPLPPPLPPPHAGPPCRLPCRPPLPPPPAAAPSCCLLCRPSLPLTHCRSALRRRGSRPHRPRAAPRPHPPGAGAAVRCRRAAAPRRDVAQQLGRRRGDAASEAARHHIRNRRCSLLAKGGRQPRGGRVCPRGARFWPRGGMGRACAGLSACTRAVRCDRRSPGPSHTARPTARSMASPTITHCRIMLYCCVIMRTVI